MRLLFALFFSLCFWTNAFSVTGVWISLEGDVEPSMNVFVRRAIVEAKEHHPDYILFEINTFGGRLDAAFDIVDTILSLSSSDSVKTISVVKNKAISAGSLIALSANELYMLNGTTIGDCAPIVQNSDGTPQIVGEKIQSPLRAKFRNLAQKNHYPELLSAAMVTPELEIYELKNKDSSLFIEASNYERFTAAEKAAWESPKVIVKSGELLTMTEKEAFALGFAKQIISSRTELEKVLGITESYEIKKHAGERFSGFVGAISGLLLIIGFGALYMEFKTPGFGIFGVIGIVALALVFFGSAAGHIDNFLPLVLLIAGIALFVVEIFVLPGTMIFGILGIVSFIAALALTFDISSLPAFLPTITVDSSPVLSALLYILCCAALALIVPFVVSKYIVPLLPEGYSPMLKTDLADSVSPTEEVANILPGACGTAKTFLRPVGHAEFEGKIFDVQTSESEIEPGTLIEVVRIQDGRIWVKKKIS